MSITKASELDLNALTFSDVKVNNRGLKMVYVNYNKGKLMIQTPKMYVPNGLKRWRKKDAIDNKEDSFELELSFGTGENTDPNSEKIKKFHEKIKQYDEIIKKQIMEHSKEWLGKSKVSMDTIEDAFYISSNRVPTDKDGNVLEYPSRIKAKLDRERVGDTDNFTGRFLANKKSRDPVMLFDDSKQLVDFNEANAEAAIPKGSKVICVLELVYLSITTKVSTKWKLVQAKVEKNQQSINSYVIDDDEEEGEKTLEDPIKEDLDTDAEPEEEVEATAEVENEEEVEPETDLLEEVPVEKPKKSRGKK